MPIQYQTAKCSMCRREGTKLFLKGDKCFTPKCPVARRPYAPGQHGPTARRGKLSVFGTQLREKQKAKRVYGISEAQFARYIEMAGRKVGNTETYLQQLLETRLDNTVYRLGLAQSRAEARQRVSHGHIFVNGHKVSIPSYRVAIGDIITVDSEKAFASIVQRIQKHQTPSWLALEAGKLQGKVVAEPSNMDFETTFDAKQIIEFYSR